MKCPVCDKNVFDSYETYRIIDTRSIEDLINTPLNYIQILATTEWTCMCGVKIVTKQSHRYKLEDKKDPA